MRGEGREVDVERPVLRSWSPKINVERPVLRLWSPKLNVERPVLRSRSPSYIEYSLYTVVYNCIHLYTIVNSARKLTRPGK